MRLVAGVEADRAFIGGTFGPTRVRHGRSSEPPYDEAVVGGRSGEDAAFEHAWQWFHLHATQRMQMVNFWLVSVAFIAAGYVGAVADGLLAVATGVAVVGALVTSCFYRLERRSKQLIQLVEPVLAEFQHRWADETGIAPLDLLAAADAQKGRLTSYGSVIRLMHWSVTLAFLVGAVGAAVALVA